MFLFPVNLYMTFEQQLEIIKPGKLLMRIFQTIPNRKIKQYFYYSIFYFSFLIVFIFIASCTRFYLPSHHL